MCLGFSFIYEWSLRFDKHWGGGTVHDINNGEARPPKRDGSFYGLEACDKGLVNLPIHNIVIIQECEVLPLGKTHPPVKQMGTPVYAIRDSDWQNEVLDRTSLSSSWAAVIVVINDFSGQRQPKGLLLQAGL